MKGIAVVAGGGSAIARAFIASTPLCDQFDVHVLSSSEDVGDGLSADCVHRCDYSVAAIESVATRIAETGQTVERLYIFNGVLHSDTFQPERSLKQIDPAAMMAVLNANTVVPMQLIAGFFPLLRRASSPKVVALSARVGSIADNNLGGWYSYRGSKAALNMMLKSAAIELARHNKATRVIAFHPGTTDSPLSKPFQKGVPPEKLFTPEFTAECLWKVVETTPQEAAFSYLDWAGQPIAP